MQLKEITCIKCGASLDESSFTSNRNFVRCQYCNTVFTISSTATENPDAKANDRIIPTPDGVTVSYDNGISIEYKWYSVKYIIMLVFALIWSSFMVGWYSIAIKTGTGIMAAAGTLHALIGLMLLYWSIAGLRNKTNINVTDVIEIKHGPMPWPGNKIIKSEDIIQFYCKQKINQGKNGKTYSYELHAILNNQKTIKILGMLEEPELAFFIEKKIENHLNIVDVAVANEYKG